MKREFRYIRYRICRSIYYADQCPMDNRKNYSNIGRDILCAWGSGFHGSGCDACMIVHWGRTFLPRKNLCKLPIDKSHIVCYNRS